jgi:hypothetical protein
MTPESAVSLSEVSDGDTMTPEIARRLENAGR